MNPSSQKIMEIISKYGQPPLAWEEWDTAWEKLLNCVVKMDEEIRRLKYELQNK